MEIYVGNLPRSIDDQGLADLFSPYGEDAKAKCMSDRETGRSRGFGFVTMNDPTATNAAIQPLTVSRGLLGSPAMARPARPLPAMGNPIHTGHFDVGLGYGTVREHGTADWLLIATVRGSGRFGHAGGELRTGPGDVVLLSPGS